MTTFRRPYNMVWSSISLNIVILKTVTIKTNNNMQLNNTKELLAILKSNTNQLHASIETGLPQGNISRALNSSCSLATFVKICNASNMKIELKKVEDAE